MSEAVGVETETSSSQTGEERKPKRRLGRRPISELGVVENKQVILNEAEKVFAMQGYLGASLKQIATRSNVTQALITYYFGTKQNLFLEIYKRRLTEIAKARQAGLLEIKSKGEPVTLSDVVRTYITPQFEHRGGGQDWVYFARMQSRLASEPEEITAPLRREVYDQTLKIFIQEMISCEGVEHHAAVSWGVVFMIAMILYMLRDIDRIGEITDGHVHTGVEADVVEKMTLFITAGINALKE